MAAQTPGRRPVVLLPSPIVEVRDERLEAHGVRLLMKRDDLVNAAMPGNKWRKLNRNLTAAAEQEHNTLLTFGGAYSNHIAATAAAGWHFGFSTIGVIRGEEHRPLNPVLAGAAGQGMQLTYLDRTRYREKHTPVVLDELYRQFGRFYLLPEGGSNELAVHGCAEVAAEIVDQVPDVDVVCCPVGTGGTLAGIAGGLGPRQQAVGVAVLKGGGFLTGEVAGLQRAAFGAVSPNWKVIEDFHFGGYARRNAALDRFITDFADRHGLVLDWVYVAKMMYGVYAMVADRRIPAGSTVVAVITGRCEDLRP